MFKKLFSDNVSLSTALSIETSNIVSGDASLSTTLSTGDASYEYEYSTTHIQLNRNRTKILLNKYFKHISKINLSQAVKNLHKIGRIAFWRRIY